MYIPLLSLPGVEFATFDRHGGVGQSPYGSCNVSFGVKDDPAVVDRNRLQIKEAMGLAHLVSANQVHDDTICSITKAITADQEIDQTDGLIIDQKGVGLMVQHADCQAVLLYDPVQQVIAAVHSGWRGNVLDITGKTVNRMKQQYGCRPDRMVAVISPSLGPCCAQFVNHKKELPASFADFQVKPDYFDFWQITRFQLMSQGLTQENIHIAAICTSCSDDFFSYRRACRNNNGITGRNCTVIALRSPYNPQLISKT